MFYEGAAGRRRISEPPHVPRRRSRSLERRLLFGMRPARQDGLRAAGRAFAPHRPKRAPAPDALFAHVVDQSKSVAPIGPEERAERRARLKRILASLGGGALLLEGGATMTYLTGVSWWRSERLFALVVPAEGSHFWICPAFEQARARSTIDAADGAGGDIVVWQEHEYPYAASRRRSARSAHRKGLHRAAASVDVRGPLVGALRQGAARFGPGGGLRAARQERRARGGALATSQRAYAICHRRDGEDAHPGHYCAPKSARASTAFTKSSACAGLGTCV